MTSATFLRSYRETASELAILRAQRCHISERLSSAEHLGKKWAQLSAQLERINQMIGQAEAQQSSMAPQFDRLMGLTYGRSRVILLQYYSAGMTDAEIADSMGYSTRQINSLRNECVRALPELPL